MKMKAALIVFLLTGFLLSGCQQTPEINQVIHKEQIYGSSSSDNRSEEVSEANNQESVLDNSGLFTKNYVSEKGMLEVNISSTVINNDNGSFDTNFMVPVGFKSSLVKNIISYFFPNDEIYEDTSHILTKSDIQEKIVALKSKEWKIEENDNSQVDEGSSWSSNEGLISDSNEYIEYLQKQYETAPNEYPLNPISMDTIIDSNEKGINVGIMGLPNGTIPTLEIAFSDDNMDNILSYRALPKGYDYFDIFQPLNDTPRQLSLSVGDATEIATDLMKQLGFEDYTISATYLGNKYDTNLASPEFFESRLYLEESPQCYIFRFSRTQNGLNANDVRFHDNDTLGVQNDTYIKLFKEEMIELAIDDSGIIGFTWEYPVGNKEVAQQNLSLLGASKSIDIFMDQMKQLGAGIESSGVGNETKRSINIDTIRLGTMQAVAKDKKLTCLVIPVWDFYGYVVDGEDKKMNAGYSIMTINALDGSIIDRGVGY